MKYIGDLSRQDVQVLATYASQANRIIEFGAGASTQIIAEHAPAGAWFECVETDKSWVDRTIANLQRIGITSRPDFATWDAWLLATPRVIDLAFDDGIDDLRMDFAMRVWPMLRIGGVLLFHDTRHLVHLERVLSLVRAFHNEIDVIRVNERASNITAVVKKCAEPYRNWNEVEKLAEKHGWQ